MVATLPKVLNQKIGRGFCLYNGDCFELIKGLPDESIHYTIFSPPFASLYTFSASERDASNCKDDAEFYEHFRFLIPELLRVTKPGRLLSFHCLNLTATKQSNGYIGQKDFRGWLIRLFLGDDRADFVDCMARLGDRLSQAKADGEYDRALKLEDAIATMQDELEKYPSEMGWIFHSEVTIWKDPVTAMQRTKAIGLLHKQLVKDSSISRQGMPDYLITMRKVGDNREPVSGLLDTFVGDDPPAKESSEVRNSINIWQRYASPVWMDINPSDTLQYRSARENDDERHICPLAIPVIDRALQLWSNPNDIVLSPFLGIGSECYSALRMGRRAVGFELKRSYFECAVKNLSALEETSQVSLFDMLEAV